MNQLNHTSLREESCETKTSNLISRPTSLDLSTTLPLLEQVAKSKELENIKEVLKDSPTLKQALLNIANSPELNLTSPGDLNLSQILNSLISSSPSMTNATTLTTFSPGGLSFPSLNKTTTNNLLTNIAGHNQLMIQPGKDLSALNNSGLTYHTILNLCQQQQQQNQLLKPLNLLEHNILTGNQQTSQPQLILLAQSTNPSGLTTLNPQTNGQSFPISLSNNQTASLNLVKNDPVDSLPNESDLIEESSEIKRKNLKRELDPNDSGGINKIRRRKTSPIRLDLNQDSSGCLSPSGKTNCSGSPKGADSNSSNNNYPSSDPFEKSRLLRLEKKRARNRDAAKKCRERKLTLIRSLEVHVSQLAEDNRTLKARLLKSRAEVERLKTFVVEHLEKDCEFKSKINALSNDLPASPTSA